MTLLCSGTVSWHLNTLMRVPRQLQPTILSTETVAPYRSPDHHEVSSLEYNGDDYSSGDNVQRNSSAHSYVPIDLHIIPWGEVLPNGVQLINTCTVDNWLMIFQALVKSNRIDLLDLHETGQNISTIMQLIEQGQFAEAKLAVLQQPPQIHSNLINFYGNEDDYFIKLLRPYLQSNIETECILNTCPTRNHTSIAYTVNLGHPHYSTHSNVVLLAHP